MRWKCVCVRACVCVCVQASVGVYFLQSFRLESHAGPWIFLAQRDVRPLNKPGLKARSYLSIIFYSKKDQSSQCPNANISPTFISQIYSNLKSPVQLYNIQMSSTNVKSNHSGIIKPFTVHGHSIQQYSSQSSLTLLQ